MNPGGNETDALLRQLRGYIKLWTDPPLDQQGTTVEETRDRAVQLFLESFAELDKRISRGELLPEAWDQYMRFTPRVRSWGPGEYVFVYPPGTVGPAPCSLRSKAHGCQWLNPGADNTCCSRCHTIRIRKYGPPSRRT